MQLDLDNLPTDTALLHRLVRDIVGGIEHRDTEIGRLKSIIKQLQRAQFGRRSERLDPDQLALGLEDLDSDLAREEENRPRIEIQQAERSSHRKPLPDHLPREDVRLDIDRLDFQLAYGSPAIFQSAKFVRISDTDRLGAVYLDTGESRGLVPDSHPSVVSAMREAVMGTRTWYPPSAAAATRCASMDARRCRSTRSCWRCSRSKTLRHER